MALSDEIDMQRLYLDIERIRFPERLSVIVDVPEDLEDARVPGLILQPLVENAVKHGVARSGAPVTITIRARADNGSIHLTVEDDVPMAPSISAGATASVSAMLRTFGWRRRRLTARRAPAMGRGMPADSGSI